MTQLLLLMDYQEGICSPDSAIGGSTGLAAEAERRQILANAARCLEAARRGGLAVVHTYVAFDSAYALRTNRSAAFAQYEQNRMLLEGTPDAAICQEVKPIDGEPVLRRSWVDPLIGTALPGLLGTLKPERLYFGGIATNFVVESAARHAGDLGYDVCVLEDLCSSFSQELHAVSIEQTLPVFAEIASSAALLDQVAA